MTPKRLILTGCWLALVALAWKFINAALPVEGAISTNNPLYFALLAAAMLVPAGFFFAIAHVNFFSFPFTRWIDAVFGLLPDNRKPPLDLAIADRLEQHEGPEAAEREYLRLLDYYPRNLEVWIRLIALRSEAFGAEAASATLEEARRELKRDRVAMKTLDQMEKHSERLKVTAGNA